MTQLVLKSFKYRIYPTKEQSSFLDRNFGAVRYLWNQFVASFNHNFIGPCLPQDEKFIKDLSTRDWTCPSCGTKHDRDLNASVNILYKGLDDLYSLTSAELADYRRRESVNPKVEIPKVDSLKRLVSFIDFYKTA